MDYQFLILEKEGRVLTVKINRPDERNALSAGLMKELTRVAAEIREDYSLIAVVLSGGNQFFSAGLDLKDPEIISILTKPIPVRRRLLEMGPRMCRAWEEIPQVTIAALEGFCIGGAVSLVLACDFRLMAENAFLRISEIDLGMNYSWGSLPRLVNLVGPAKAKEWVILADKVECPEAIQYGFAQSKAVAGQAISGTMPAPITSAISRPPSSRPGSIQSESRTSRALTSARSRSSSWKWRKGTLCPRGNCRRGCRISRRGWSRAAS